MWVLRELQSFVRGFEPFVKVISALKKVADAIEYTWLELDVFLKDRLLMFHCHGRALVAPRWMPLMVSRVVRGLVSIIMRD